MGKPTELQQPTYFVDRSLGAHDVPSALRTAGVEVQIHDALFEQNTRDEEWLRQVGENGWVVLTKDARIRRNELELEALMSANVAAFILTAASLTGTDMAALLVKLLPKIGKLVRTRVRPFIATISASGDIKIIRGGERRGAARK